MYPGYLLSLCNRESTESFQRLALRTRPSTSAAYVQREKDMKSSLQIKKISVRRTGDIRLTSAMCAGTYHVTV
jgi:hypothetical protein